MPAAAGCLPGLIAAEIRHRPWAFALAVAAIAAALAAVAATLLPLADFDRRTEAAAAVRQAAVDAELSRLQDQVRKAALQMGFNLMILHRDQDLAGAIPGEPMAAGMPEAWGDRLAAARPATINHLCPMLHGRAPWPERGGEARIVGVKGVIFLQSAKQIPMEDEVRPGTVVLGRALAERLGIGPGGSLMLAGRAYAVAGIKAGRGAAVDLAIWMALADAQALLGQPGRISALYAIGCECGEDRVAAIRREIAATLPEVQVLEFSQLADARQAMRERTASAAAAAAAIERAARQDERAARRRLAWTVGLACAAAAMVAVTALAALNARARSDEIGIWRAVGMPRRRILGLLLGRAAVAGGLGGCLGLAAGAIAAAIGGDLLWPGWLPALAAIAAAPALAIAATLPPALLAAAADPAEALRDG